MPMGSRLKLNLLCKLKLFDPATDETTDLPDPIADSEGASIMTKPIGDSDTEDWVLTIERVK